jgi:hypothetical protein
MSNVEGMYSIYLKKIEQSETTLRNSAVRYSAVLRFAVPAGFGFQGANS